MTKTNAYMKAALQSIADDIHAAVYGFQGSFALASALDKVEKLLSQLQESED